MKYPVRLALIAARAANGVIGKDNAMPWHLPEDLQYFKRQTLSKPVIMGRKTFESLGRPLPGRENLVVSRSGYEAEGARVFSDLPAALDEAMSIAEAKGAKEVMVIGGAQIYEQALPVADRLYLTEIAQDIDGDTYFPTFSPAEWKEAAREDHADHDPPYAFVIYDRVAAP